MVDLAGQFVERRIKKTYTAIINGIPSEPVEISLPIEGVQQLTLLVDYGENLDTGDNVHFVDLRVTR